MPAATRNPRPFADEMSPGQSAVLVLLMGALCALLLAGPAATVTTKYVNDLFVFLDGAHRIDLGQVPNRDFHTALGPLTFYIPALGYWLGGSWGAAMPLGMGLLVAVAAPIAAHIAASRLRPFLALPLAAYLLVMLAMPLNPGESVRSISFAMFYNRIGWSALGLLLLMYLPPVRTSAGGNLRDAVCAAALTLVMLYTKASYGLVAAGFLVFMLTDRAQRGWALSALAMVLGAGLGIEAVWRGTLAHVADLALAGRVSGGLGTPDKIGDVVLRNLADYVVFALIAGIALICRRSFRDLLFYGFCALSGFLLMRQNFQVWGIVILAPGAAVAAELIRREMAIGTLRRSTLAAGAPLACLGLVIPPLAQGAAALVLHAGLAVTNAGERVPLPRFHDIRLVRLWVDAEFPAFTKYFETLRDGAADLTVIPGRDAPVLVLDFVNPFSAGLGLRPPGGDAPWYHWSRTLDEATHPDASELFRDVEVVMEPKWPIEAWTANGMRELYASRIAQDYVLARESEHWRVYARRSGAAAVASGSETRPEPSSASATRQSTSAQP